MSCCVSWTTLFIAAVCTTNCTRDLGGGDAGFDASMDVSACSPACAMGATCISGVCVAECNPRCATDELCTPVGRCAPRTVSLDDIRRACVMQRSCLQNAPIGSATACTYELQRAIATGFPAMLVLPPDVIRRFARCAHDSTDCASALRCATLGHDPTYCATHDGVTCDGAVLVPCYAASILTPDRWPILAMDCAQYGLRCDASRGLCVTASPSCDPATSGTGVRCAGRLQIECYGDPPHVRAADCRTYVDNGVCVAEVRDGGSSYGCAPDAPACSPDGARCEGATLVRCLFGREQRIDCARTFDGTCVAATTGADCQPTATECTRDSPDRCAGDSIESCANGRYVATSCASFGLRTCAPRGATAVTCVM